MRLSIKAKLSLSLCAIAAILLVSAIISVLEYAKMSNYVSDLIADDVSSLNTAHKLSDICSKYNLEILTVIGDDFYADLPEFDQEYFLSHCEQLRSSMESNVISPLTDSVIYSCSAYVLTSLELENVLDSYFIDSRSWYFNRLQPSFQLLMQDIGSLENAIYADLERNSLTFERSFYRSVIPGMVSAGAGILLVLMLLFFINSFYLNPLYRMLGGLDGYRQFGKKYTVDFEGDDQLAELNSGISEVTNENILLRKRIKDLKAKAQDELESDKP